jgi:hypothetical protein
MRLYIKQRIKFWGSQTWTKKEGKDTLRVSLHNNVLKHTCGKKDGISVYVPKETILKEMAAKIE